MDKNKVLKLDNLSIQHTLSEWWHNNEQQIRAAEDQQEWAQRLTSEAERLIYETHDSVIKNKLEIDHQSKVKVNDIEFKKKEIQNKKNDLDEEINMLLVYEERIKNANNSLVGDAMDIIAECLKLRKERIGIDLVFDDVERELLRERLLIVGINDQLEELLDKVVLQLRKLRSFAYNLSVDLEHKENVLKIEAHNEQLSDNSIEISVLNSKHMFLPAKISAEEWDQYSSNIIAAANKTLVNGRPLRAYFDKCLNKMIEDLVDQANIVNETLRQRTEEYREIIEKLHQQQGEVFGKIEDVQETINKLQKAIDDKEAYIALAHTRLKNRTLRKGIELCRDELEVKLHAEVAELEENVKRLQEMLANSLECLKNLKQSSVRIETQLKIKENSLYIDSVLCVKQRNRINFQTF
ncbi:tektin-1-like [Daktulosphaira vitifoliae]|uniref:tektin-1-like n=1 Tax=Daktulosphaira vitifoliae TaxID=58002 RepID=UPI0021AA7856|nr:tektin-1-like [Daktulosphaira vitifoliae]